MSHYVIGDVQGCFDELVLLCKKIKFNPNKDRLIFAGDLVNRGPKSLEVLNFCLENKSCVTSVMGNHDFYLMYLLEHKKKNKSLVQQRHMPHSEGGTPRGGSRTFQEAEGDLTSSSS